MKCSLLLICALISALLLSHAPVAESATCNPVQLSACAGAIMQGTPPSAACCSNLKQQTPCLCQYIRNPRLKGYITSPNAKKVASTCGVPIPKC